MSDLPVYHSQALMDFQVACQRFMVCFSITGMGLLEYSKDLQSRTPKPENTLTIGSGHPNVGKVHARLKILEVIESCKKDGQYSDYIAKAFITTIYSEWEEMYRPQMSRTLRIEMKYLKCDLMGDLRLIRNCIVHGNSVINDEHKKIKELRWKLRAGPLTVTGEMFSQLVDQINVMVVRHEPEPK